MLSLAYPGYDPPTDPDSGFALNPSGNLVENLPIGQDPPSSDSTQYARYWFSKNAMGLYSPNGPGISNINFVQNQMLPALTNSLNSYEATSRDLSNTMATVTDPMIAQLDSDLHHTNTAAWMSFMVNNLTSIRQKDQILLNTSISSWLRDINYTINYAVNLINFLGESVRHDAKSNISILQNNASKYLQIDQESIKKLTAQMVAINRSISSLENNAQSSTSKFLTTINNIRNEISTLRSQFTLRVSDALSLAKISQGPTVNDTESSIMAYISSELTSLDNTLSKQAANVESILHVAFDHLTFELNNIDNNVWVEINNTGNNISNYKLNIDSIDDALISTDHGVIQNLDNDIQSLISKFNSVSRDSNQTIVSTIQTLNASNIDFNNSLSKNYAKINDNENKASSSQSSLISSVTNDASSSASILTLNSQSVQADASKSLSKSSLAIKEQLRSTQLDSANADQSSSYSINNIQTQMTNSQKSINTQSESIANGSISDSQYVYSTGTRSTHLVNDLVNSVNSAYNLNTNNVVNSAASSHSQSVLALTNQQTQNDHNTEDFSNQVSYQNAIASNATASALSDVNSALDSMTGLSEVTKAQILSLFNKVLLFSQSTQSNSANASSSLSLISAGVNSATSSSFNQEQSVLKFSANKMSAHGMALATQSDANISSILSNMTTVGSGAIDGSTNDLSDINAKSAQTQTRISEMLQYVNQLALVQLVASNNLTQYKDFLVDKFIHAVMQDIRDSVSHVDAESKSVFESVSKWLTWSVSTLEAKINLWSNQIVNETSLANPLWTQILGIHQDINSLDLTQDIVDKEITTKVNSMSDALGNVSFKVSSLVNNALLKFASDNATISSTIASALDPSILDVPRQALITYISQLEGDILLEKDAVSGLVAVFQGYLNSGSSQQSKSINSQMTSQLTSAMTTNASINDASVQMSDTQAMMSSTSASRTSRLASGLHSLNSALGLSVNSSLTLSQEIAAISAKLGISNAQATQMVSDKLGLSNAELFALLSSNEDLMNVTLSSSLAATNIGLNGLADLSQAFSASSSASIEALRASSSLISNNSNQINATLYALQNATGSTYNSIVSMLSNGSANSTLFAANATSTLMNAVPDPSQIFALFGNLSKFSLNTNIYSYGNASAQLDTLTNILQNLLSTASINVMNSSNYYLSQVSSIGTSMASYNNSLSQNRTGYLNRLENDLTFTNQDYQKSIASIFSLNQSVYNDFTAANASRANIDTDVQTWIQSVVSDSNQKLLNIQNMAIKAYKAAGLMH